MKKIYIIPLLYIVIVLCCNIVYAGTFHSVDLDVFIDKNGDAKITEVWDYTADSGTENYKTYNNMGNSTIVDLEVKDGKNEFATLDSWDVNASFKEKTNKCGINYIKNGAEICWGIGEYGRHTYTITYTITDFVSQLNDAQMAYWELIPKGNQVSTVNIVIRSEVRYSDTSVWGYGYRDGICQIQNGQVIMKPNGSKISGEYMTVLIKFPNGTFNADNIIKKNFDYYLDMSQEGISEETTEIIFNIFCAIFVTLMVMLFIILFVGGYYESTYDFGDTGRKIPKDVPMYRDIPLNGNLFRAYFVAKAYKIMPDKTNLLGAILLKWNKEKRIKIEITDDKNLFKKNNTTIIFSPEIKFESELEKELYDNFIEASKDYRLESKEFEKWCENHSKTILDWFDKVIKEELPKLEMEHLVSSYNVKVLFADIKRYKIDSGMMQYAKQMAGLKKYLLEYTLIENREAPEVVLFEEYLIYAQLMGIADKVAKQFKKIYPKEIYEQYDNVCNTALFACHVSKVGISSARSVQSSRSYGGGGGGSFGGGGGMGSR